MAPSHAGDTGVDTLMTVPRVCHTQWLMATFLSRTAKGWGYLLPSAQLAQRNAV